MFSDRYRILKMLLAVVGLVLLGVHYTQFATDHPHGFRAASAEPAAHDGARLLFPLWEVTRIHGATRYAISKSLRDVPINGASDGLAVGDSVTVRGRFRAQDGSVVAAERIDHPYRSAKAVLSIAALVWCAVVCRKRFGFEGGAVVIRG